MLSIILIAYLSYFIFRTGVVRWRKLDMTAGRCIQIVCTILHRGRFTRLSVWCRAFRIPDRGTVFLVCGYGAAYRVQVSSRLFRHRISKILKNLLNECGRVACFDMDVFILYTAAFKSSEEFNVLMIFQKKKNEYDLKTVQFYIYYFFPFINNKRPYIGERALRLLFYWNFRSLFCTRPRRRRVLRDEMFSKMLSKFGVWVRISVFCRKITGRQTLLTSNYGRRFGLWVACVEFLW